MSRDAVQVRKCQTVAQGAARGSIICDIGLKGREGALRPGARKLQCCICCASACTQDFAWGMMHADARMHARPAVMTLKVVRTCREPCAEGHGSRGLHPHQALLVQVQPLILAIVVADMVEAGAGVEGQHLAHTPAPAAQEVHRQLPGDRSPIQGRGRRQGCGRLWRRRAECSNRVHCPRSAQLRHVRLPGQMHCRGQQCCRSQASLPRRRTVPR